MISAKGTLGAILLDVAPGERLNAIKRRRNANSSGSDTLNWSGHNERARWHGAGTSSAPVSVHCEWRGRCATSVAIVCVFGRSCACNLQGSWSEQSQFGWQTRTQQTSPATIHPSVPGALHAPSCSELSLHQAACLQLHSGGSNINNNNDADNMEQCLEISSQLRG